MRLCLLSSVILAWSFHGFASAAESERTEPAVGLRDHTPTVHALVGARLVLAPGRVIDQGTVVVRGAVIESVGADVVVPDDARIHPLQGKTVYAGLIDAYDQIDVGSQPDGKGASHWNRYVQPQRRASAGYKPDAALNKKLRSQGITSRLLAPKGQIIKGSSALVSTADQAGDGVFLADDVAMHAQLTVPRPRERKRYPNSPMGAVALARQTMYDAQWYRNAWTTYRAQRGVDKPELNHALQTLQSYLDGQHRFVIEAPDEQYLMRADRFGREFGLNVIVLGSGHEYRRIQDVRQANRVIILPLNFAKPPNVATIEAARSVSLEDLMHWDLAPENPRRLFEAGLSLAFTSQGLSKKEDFLPAVRQAVSRGLPADEALRALTEFPARLFGVDDKLGSLEQGKLAHLVVTDGDLFDKKSKVLETWVNGERHIVTAQPKYDLSGEWRVKAGDKLQQFTLKISGNSPSLKAQWVSNEPDSKETPLKNVRIQARQLTATFDGDLLDEAGIVRLSAVVMPDKPQQWKLIGRLLMPSGTEHPLTARRISADPGAESTSETDPARAQDEPSASDANPEDDGSPVEDEDGDTEKPDERKASFAVNLPLGAFGREQPPERPEWLVLANATVWTCSDRGTLANATIVVHRGRIERVGEAGQDLPLGAVVVDCRGKHITPGIIDCHSHMATDGGINESGQAITAEVRIGDFIDARDVAIYRQLAGGVTTANVLHGSANPIGGQNQVIKLRWGASPEEMKFADAPAGIKFALGENVKQSNWGSEFTTRYPQTRMGVEQIMRDSFVAAAKYRFRQEAWATLRQGLPPRRDLELEAIAEILEGTRWIHCHSYRQDEILALLRTLESFDIQIGTFQHILEGYKVADAMKQHGAMASAFSDWWAYKFEVYDAIPYNGSLMHEMGIVVSFNSDDRELARHLNHEAAKAVKYGGVTPAEALKFVTLNPARQLRIDRYVGSVEAGKQADLVVWSGPPLSTLSRCEQTWIDGQKFFDLGEDRIARARWRDMRTTLVQKILKSGEQMRKPGDKKPDERDLWPREDLYCHGGHGHGDHHNHSQE